MPYLRTNIDVVVVLYLLFFPHHREFSMMWHEISGLTSMSMERFFISLKGERENERDSIRVES